MKQRHWLGLGILFSLIWATHVWASMRELDFQEVWKHVVATSPGQRASAQAEESAIISASRSARHWFPRIYLDGRAFGTNDPGTILFSKLSERVITGQDFSPFVMNNPETQFHEKVTLGVNLMLFEGGSRIAETTFRELNANAKNQEKKARELQEYSETAAYYGSLLVTERSEKALVPLQALVNSTIERYQLGSQANPLGHSGFLGLKTLAARIQGELKMVRAKQAAARSVLNRLGGLDFAWAPKSEPVLSFLTRHLKIEATMVQPETDSYSVTASRTAGQAMHKLADAEKARFLPQVGLFGEGYLSHGPYGGATSYTAGAFLRWELFNAGNFGAIREARLSAESQQNQALAMKERQAVEFEKIANAEQALEVQLDLAEQSMTLLDEQSKIAQKLFQNGLINALQLTEVLNRRVDLVTARSQMEEQLLKMRAERINTIPFEVAAN